MNCPSGNKSENLFFAIFLIIILQSIVIYVAVSEITKNQLKHVEATRNLVETIELCIESPQHQYKRRRHED